MSSMQQIKADLLKLVSDCLPGVNVSFDYATSMEAEKAAVITNLVLNYENDLELHYRKVLRFGLILIAKNDSDLDEIIEMAESLSDQSNQTIKYVMLDSLEYVGTDDPDDKYSIMNLSCDVWDVEE